MEIKSAIQYLQDSKCKQNQGEAYQEQHDAVLNIAIKGLEKQMPIPIYWGDMICPICKYQSKNNDVLRGYEKYCFNCGQKLKWEHKD